MQKIAITELVDFRRKPTDITKRNYAYKLKNREAKEKIKDDNDKKGGDYWKTSTSCIYNVVKYNNEEFYESKIDNLLDKIDSAEDDRAKFMFKRNIDILNGFKDFDIESIRPLKILNFEKVQRVQKIITVDDFPLYINPSLLFTYEKNGKVELGAIWLVPKLYGFKKIELGMFCEMLHEFLIKFYADSYQISDSLCIAIDTYNAQKVDFQELLDGDVPFLIHKTLKELQEYN